MRRAGFACLTLLLGCPKPHPAPPPTSSPPTSAGSTAAAPDVPAALQGTEPADDIKPVYAGNPEPDPLAQRLCDLIDILPLQRQAACCKAPQAAPVFQGECARIVTLALQGKRLTLDAAKVAACEADTRKQLEDCDRVLSPVAPALESCQGLFQGTLEAGGACRSDLECQSGLTCVGLGPTDPGKCSEAAPAGVPCHPVIDPLAVYTKQSLEDHPSCEGYCNRHQCADVLAPGAACLYDSQCGPKNRCHERKCVAGRPALGGPCTTLGDCPLDATCADGVCKLRDKTGAACTQDDQCLGECDKATGGGHCGPRCPHAFVPVFSHPQ
jgi:hypothetical protein